MRLLFISNYFPPEVNAPATRLFEHARHWLKDGHTIEVMTSVPNFPEGEIYTGYSNRFSKEVVSGVDVTRVPMYIAENKGMVKRTLSYVSFMLSTLWFARRVRRRPDIIVATSPQFFAALGGFLLARLLRVPFVFEVRDLWPESIVAVGAVKRNAVIKAFEWLELLLYRRSAHIVVVTDAFKRYIEAKGISPDRISVIKNGADLQGAAEPVDRNQLDALRAEHGLGGKFVASYIGTIGMAHRADVLLEAAMRCDDPDVVFMVVGTGAERKALEARANELKLPNFRLIDKQPRHVAQLLLALSDVSVVHLQASPLFQTVIPSKIFESMAEEKPIVLGVDGEAREIVEHAGAGVYVRPEDPDALVEAVVRLKRDSALRERMGRSGRLYVHRHYDRARLARNYWEVLKGVHARSAPPTHRADGRTESILISYEGSKRGWGAAQLHEGGSNPPSAIGQ